MTDSSTRRLLLFSAPAACLLPAQPRRPPPLPAELVKEFVSAAHADLKRTRELLERDPGLLNATWDWGGGDFESALGGASHMGEREIATFLIERGARMDLFAAAMLGQLDVVRAALTAFPAAHRSLGPHRIPLIEHARKGGGSAAAVVEYLQQFRVPAAAPGN